KKSDLATALSSLWIHEETAERMEKLFRESSVPERAVREARQVVETDRITVQKLRRTLESWRLSEAEIKAVEDEARQTREEVRFKPAEDGKPAGDSKPALPVHKQSWKDWAKVEVRAPDFDG